MKKTSNKIPSKPRLRKHLNADALFKTVYSEFEKIPDFRTDHIQVSLADALMSAFAMFSLKDPSLLAFDNRRKKGENLNSIYGIKNIPSDSRMREILDEVAPEYFRPLYNALFKKLQRGKALEPLSFMDGHYLVALDGTGFFSSHKLNADFCLEKRNKKTGEITYYLQLLGAVMVNPDFKEVIPLMPEMIIKQDGETKNDCERNAAKRFLEKLRKDHPLLKITITEDGLSANAPHIKSLTEHNLSYILGVKPGDHRFLFDYVTSPLVQDDIIEFDLQDEDNTEITHRFRFLNEAPLNKSNTDLKVNFLEYWEISDKKTKHFSWVTDIKITRDNAYMIMKGGRTRWKIENETFNTLKNQGYNFEHNFGLGKKNLAPVFAMIMMIAFLVDQIQQLCCNLFRSTWRKCGSKKTLWEDVRSLFKWFTFDSMADLYLALLNGISLQAPVLECNTS